MNMKRIAFIFLLLLSFSCCFDEGPDNRNIKIINKSSNAIYCLKSQTESFNL